MKAMKILYSIALLTVISSLITSCYGVNVEKYKGDGTIQAIGFIPTSYGYKIDFGEFDLGKNYKEVRIFREYPKIEKEAMVGVYIESSSDTLDSDLDFYLSIKMITSKGDTLFDCSGNMSSWRWSRSVGESKEKYRYFIYYMNNECESSFNFNDIPESNSTLYLHVDYEPLDVQSVANKLSTGTVRLQVGGYK